MRRGRVVSHEEVVERLKKDGPREPTIQWTEQATTRQLDQAHGHIALSNRERVAERITLRTEVRTVDAC